MEETTEHAYEVMHQASMLESYLEVVLDAQRDTGALGNEALAGIRKYTYGLTTTDGKDEEIIEAFTEALRELRGYLDRTRDAETDSRYLELRQAAIKLYPEDLNEFIL